MKKFLLLTISLFLTSNLSFADSYMPLPDAVNSRMFSTEGARPLVNLERTNYTNKAIMQIEAKQNPRKETEQKNTTQPEPTEPAQKTRFKDLFKGFVIEY